MRSIQGSGGNFKVRLEQARNGDRVERAVNAEIVLIAASHAGSSLDSSGFLERMLFPFRAQALSLAEIPGEIRECLPESPMSSHFCYEYFRRSEDTLVIGGMRWSVRGEEVGIVDDTAINREIHRNILLWARTHFPSLEEANATHAWTGILCGTPDGLPISGMVPGRPGLFVLAGFNGYGLSMALALAKSISQEIIHGKSEYPWAGIFRPDRFS